MDDDNNDPSLFNSEAQERLSALLAKAVSVVPFACDEDCDTAFFALADFCNAALASKRERSQTKFSAMGMEELIALAGGLDTAGQGQVVRRNHSAQQDSAGVVMKVKRRRESIKEEDEEDPRQQPTAVTPKWTFEQAYNIVHVTSIECDPLRIVVMARPPVAGNQKPVAYAMDGDDVDGVEGQRGRNGTKLRKTLANALHEYSEANQEAIAPVLIAKLKRFDWSKEIASELE